MSKRLVLPMLVLLLTAACTAQDEPTAATATPPGAAAPATAPATAPPATTVPADTTPPATTATPAVDPAAEAAAAQAAAAAASGPALVPGTDYVEIAGGQPFDPLNGKIEVVEVFGYTCPHCASFQQLVNAWKAKLPGDVRFTYVPAPFGGYWIPYAKAYYAAESLGALARTHDAVFKAIHIDRSLPVQPLPTNEQIAAFYAGYGVDPQQFASAMSSFAVAGKLNRAKQFIQRSGVDSTPVLVVNGKYRITGRSLEDTLRIANQLIAAERAAQERAARG